MYTFREAREEDREEVVKLLTTAFKEIDSFKNSWIDSWKNYWNHPENFDWAFVATCDDKIIANLSYFLSNHDKIRGNPLNFGGVWAVATDRKYRRKGVLKGIYELAFRDMNKRGIPISILDPSPYPFAQMAYERMGYAIAEKRVKHSFTPNSMKMFEGLNDISVRKIENPDENIKIAELESKMSRYGSRLFTFPFFFSQGIKSGNFYILERNSDPVGCVKLIYENQDSDYILKVENAYFISDEILSFIANLISQKFPDVSRIEWICDPQIPVRYFASNIKNIETQYVESMLMRVVNFKKYCDSIRAPKGKEFSLSIKLSDNFCPWNEGIYDLTLSEGIFNIDKVDAEYKTDVTLDPHGLSNVVSGYMYPSELRKYGIISCSLDTALKLDSIFPVDSLQAYYRF